MCVYTHFGDTFGQSTKKIYESNGSWKLVTRVLEICIAIQFSVTWVPFQNYCDNLLLWNCVYERKWDPPTQDFPPNPIVISGEKNSPELIDLGPGKSNKFFLLYPTSTWLVPKCTGIKCPLKCVCVCVCVCVCICMCGWEPKMVSESWIQISKREFVCESTSLIFHSLLSKRINKIWQYFLLQARLSAKIFK